MVANVGGLGPGDGVRLLAWHLGEALLLVVSLALLLIDSLGHRLADVLAVGLDAALLLNQ